MNLEQRKLDHEYRAFNNYPSNREYYKPFYMALRKYGLENFSYEVLDYCSKKDLNKKEEYYINYYDTYKNGYNATAGGDMLLPPCDGENHPLHKLTKNDVIDIRNRYANHEMKDYVYEDYKDLIGESGFHKIWNGENWKNIHMDVYTKENKAFHTLVRNSHAGKGNGRRLSIE